MSNIGVTQWFLDVPIGPESLSRARDLGFSLIHINSGCPSDTHYIGSQKVARAYQTEAKNQDVTISAISCNVLEEYGILVDETNKIDAGLKNAITEIIKVAISLEVPVLYFPSFGKSEIKNESDFIKTVEILKYACLEISSASMQFPIQIATENSLSAIDNKRLFEAVDNPNLHLLFDTQNPLLWKHSIKELLLKHFSRMINQIHVKDGFCSNLGNAPLGKGDTSLADTLKYLHQLGYSGAFVLENDYRVDASKKIKEDLSNLSELLKFASHNE